MFRKRQKQPSLVKQIIGIAVMALVLAVAIPAIFQHRSMWNLVFNRVADNRPIEPFVAAAWGSNPRQVAKVYGKPDKTSTFQYRTNAIDYYHKLIWEYPVNIIYRFADNRLEGVLCQFDMKNLTTDEITAWIERCDGQLQAQMRNADRFIMQNPYPRQAYEAYYMNADTIVHMEVWQQTKKQNSTDEPPRDMNLATGIFCMDRTQHPELEARLMQYLEQNKLPGTEASP